MKIGGRPSQIRSGVAAIWARSKTMTVLVTIAFLLLATAAASYHEYKNNLSFRKSIWSLTADRGARGAIDAVASAPARYASALISSRELKTLRIDIKFRNWQKILRKRRDALEYGTLHTAPDDEVDARIFFDGRKTPIKMRLKGDWLDHLDGDRGWSFRVRVKDRGHVFGMRRFSIQHPRSRAYYTEPLFLEHMRREGIVAPRYKFARVFVNGKNWGVMAIEEHFSKELLESQGRKENILGRIDEGLYWAEISRKHGYRYADNFQTNPFKPFSRNKLELDPRLRAQARAADGIFAAFQEGRLSAAETFDLDLFARFVVICEAWRGHHALRWHNVRFYLNPYTLRFEPVAYDHGENTLFHGQSEAAAQTDGDLVATLLRDPAMLEAIARESERILATVDRAYLETLTRDVQRDAINAIALENPFVAPPDLVILERNLAVMRHTGPGYFELGDDRGWKRSVPEDLTEYNDRLDYVAARLYEGGTLSVVNRLPVPVQVEEVRFLPRPEPAKTGPGQTGNAETKRSRPAPEVDATDPRWQSHGVEITLAPTLDIQNASNARFAIPNAFDPAKGVVEVVSRAPGASEVRRSRIERTIPYFDDHPTTARKTAAELASTHDWLAFDEPTGTLRAMPGSWLVESSLVIPAGVPLTIPADVELRFGPDASLRMSAQLQLRGTKDAPIVLRASSDDGSWGGIYVNQAGGTSTWEHVHVSGTRAYERDRLLLTGAITFRKSKVEIRDTTFSGTRAEDALNIIHSDFVLERVRITDTRSDAFDCDYCIGRISDASFSDIGGDAFDVSGSIVELDRSSFERVHDKAISAGEGSNVAVSNVTIDESGSAIVSKDASNVTVDGAQVNGVKVAALMAYIKKPEFGPATMNAERVEIQNTTTPAIAQLGSHLALNGVNIEPLKIDIAKLYETGPMQK